MIDLSIDYLGLRLRSPLVASAGPSTSDVDRIMRLADAGVGAVVLPSLFEEQIEHDTYEIDRLISLSEAFSGEADSLFPVIAEGQTPDRYLSLIEAAANRVQIPVIASLNGTSLGGWLRYADLLASAGAAAIELNLYTVAADPLRTGAGIEAEQLELIALVVEHSAIPISVKLSPYYSSFANFAVHLQDAGAAGLVLFNRFYAPDLNLETLDVMPALTLSSPDELRLPLRWIGLLRDSLSISLAASSGVHGGLDAAKAILAGANVAMTTSALLRNGPEHIIRIEAELVEWLVEHDYHSVSEAHGAARAQASADPAAYERANYIGNLTSFSTPESLVRP